MHIPSFFALRTIRPLALTLAATVFVVGCRAADGDEPSPAARAAAAAADSAAAARRDSLVKDSVRRDSVRRDSVRRDSVRRDSVRRDSIARIAARHDSASRTHRPAHRAWPKGPEPLPGSLLPEHRIIAYYGNPLSRRMGILGQLPPEEMLEHLAEVAAKWQAADSTHQVIPALHLIATVAQGKPGADGKHRLRMTDSLIEQVANWAEQKHYLLFLDIQVGQSTVQAELPRLLPYLQRPYVHLALDPEFSMKNGRLPGRYIGTMDASDVNYAVDQLARLVTEYHLPPKVLVVHRFTNDMLTNARQIRIDPRVQVVIDMDGFGSPALKKAAWRQVILREPVQFTGFKLFYNPKNDHPLMSPSQVLELDPAPLYIQYQ